MVRLVFADGTCFHVPHACLSPDGAVWQEFGDEVMRADDANIPLPFGSFDHDLAALPPMLEKEDATERGLLLRIFAFRVGDFLQATWLERIKKRVELLRKELKRVGGAKARTRSRGFTVLL